MELHSIRMRWKRHHSSWSKWFCLKPKDCQRVNKCPSWMKQIHIIVLLHSHSTLCVCKPCKGNNATTANYNPELMDPMSSSVISLPLHFISCASVIFMHLRACSLLPQSFVPCEFSESISASRCPERSFSKRLCFSIKALPWNCRRLKNFGEN